MSKKSKYDRYLVFMSIGLFVVLVCGVLSLCFLNNVTEQGTYSTKESVAKYILRYGKLPQNFCTESEFAQKTAEEQALFNIGGDVFSNEGGIVENPQGKTLLQCRTRNNRGEQQLVFFADGSAVFCTDGQIVVAMDWWQTNKLSLIFAGCAALGLVVYLVSLLCVIGGKKKGKTSEGVRAHLELSFEVVIISVAFTALLPVVFVIWLTQTIADAFSQNKQIEM